MIVPHGRGLTTQSLNERKVWNHNHLTYNYSLSSTDNLSNTCGNFLFVVTNNGGRLTPSLSWGDIKKNISAVESTLPPLRSAPIRIVYR